MKSIFLVLPVIFSVILVGCERANSYNNAQINIRENSENYDHIKKAKENEALENPYEAGQKDAQSDISSGRFL